jgi:predicted phosphodiesterase
VRRLAVLADIHGNSIALRAVMADLARQGGADAVIILGDLAVFGPDPIGVLNLLRQIGSAFHVRGNTDRYLVKGNYPSQPDGTGWQSQTLASFRWTARELGRTGLNFLASLPARQLLRLSPQHTILAVHGSPRSDEEDIRPDTPVAELVPMVNGQAYNLLLCAHTHLPCDRMAAGRRVVNAGSVGLPFDGDPRASYVLVNLRPGGEYFIAFRRVSYDIEQVVRQLVAFNHPTADIAAYNLRTALPLGQALIHTDRMKEGDSRAQEPGADTPRRGVAQQPEPNLS